MDWLKLLRLKKEKTGQFAADEQTGKVFELETEAIWDIAAALVSVVYLIAMLAFLAWQFIDISTGRMLLLRLVLQENTKQLCSDIYKIIGYAIIGGGLGGIVNGFRSILVWHAERRAFGWRHVWKYIILPLLGATLAVMVYAITRTGIAVIGGDFTLGDDLTIQALAAFAIGALSGYGSQKVFKWLDIQVNKLFRIGRVTGIQIPDLTGKNQQEVEDILQKLKLNLGIVFCQISPDPSKIDKVISQNPPPSTIMLQANSVDITIAIKK